MEDDMWRGAQRRGSADEMTGCFGIAPPAARAMDDRPNTLERAFEPLVLAQIANDELDSAHLRPSATA
jgi:hypothetical protein